MIWWIFILFAVATAKNQKKSAGYPPDEAPEEPPYGFIPDIEIYLPPLEPEQKPLIESLPSPPQPIRPVRPPLPPPIRPQPPPTQSIRPPAPQPVRPPRPPQPISPEPPYSSPLPQFPLSPQPLEPVQPDLGYPVLDDIPTDDQPSTAYYDFEDLSPGPSDFPDDAVYSNPPDEPQVLIPGSASPILLPPSPVSPLLPIPPSSVGTRPFPPSIQPTFRPPPIPPSIQPTLGPQPLPPTSGPDPGSFSPNIYEVMPAGEMAQLSAIDVMCAMSSMRIRISFDRVFDGVIYSKGFFGNSDCHFVPWGSRQSEYEFEITLNKCGTQFIDNMASGGTASLENILLLQNEPGIQEMWDVARRVQCTWQGKMDHSVASGFQVDMLDTISVAYSGDDVSAEMNVVVGRGPFGQPAQGLLKIGESLSIVISVFGSGDMDVHIHDCVAHDGDRNNGLQLSDANGCIIKKKLMGAWQFTRETSNTGASLIAYANLKAFRFPDKTDVYLECGLEICKGQCPNYCPEYPPIDFRSIPRSKRNVDADPRDATLVRAFKVIDESKENNSSALLNKNSAEKTEICLSVLGFGLGLTCLIVLLFCLSTVTIYVCIRNRKLNCQASPCKHKQRNF